MPGRHHEKIMKVEEKMMQKMPNNESVEITSQTKESGVDVSEKVSCLQELVKARVLAITTIKTIEKKKAAERRLDDSCPLGRNNVYSIGHIRRRKELATELNVLRQFRGEIGGIVISLLDKAQWCLSEEEFCDACGLTDKYQEVQDAHALFEQESEGDPNFYSWLILDYGLESSGEETKSGPLFECATRAVTKAIMSNPELKSKAREKMFRIFNAVMA